MNTYCIFNTVLECCSYFGLYYKIPKSSAYVCASVLTDRCRRSSSGTSLYPPLSCGILRLFTHQCINACTGQLLSPRVTYCISSLIPLRVGSESDPSASQNLSRSRSTPAMRALDLPPGSILDCHQA